MAKIYKIHPGIGIARVGKSTNGYFLAAEEPGGTPIELTQQGEAPFTGYKDDTFLVRRQGARFRIFEYERDDNGRETLLREITGTDAQIEWTVRLASGKAAGPYMDSDKQDEEGAGIVTPGSGFRNEPPPGFTRDDLVASIKLTASRANFEPVSRPMAQFLRQPFYIGEARTDFAGRLVVLGGMGDSGTWTDPPSRLTSFLNNPGWYDDIADGPVDAKIRFPGAEAAIEATGAWVIVGPPDFAPAITPITTLYDIAVQAFLGSDPDRIAYTNDVEPLLRRVAEYFWVNRAGDVHWATMLETLNDPNLADNGEEHRELRASVVDDTVLEGAKVLEDFRLTKRQNSLLRRWAEGDFIPGADPQRPAPNAAQILDEAALSHSVGGGFFPGIEAGLPMRSPSIYAELCRFTRGTFEDYGNVPATLTPGFLTARMACPWQADFVQCLAAWWPAQRPDIARYTEAGVQDTRQWDRSVRVGNGGNHESRKAMVDNFARLGMIEPMTVDGQRVFGETGRDPNL